MVTILILSHGQFSKEIKNSAALIVGKQEHVHAICLREGEDIEDYRKKLTKKIVKIDQGKGVLIFADLFGGTPANTVAWSMQSLEEENVEIECITGFHFPMLLEALIMREHLALQALKTHCMKTASQAIKDLRYELTKK